MRKNTLSLTLRHELSKFYRTIHLTFRKYANFIILGPMLNALNVENYINCVLLEGSTNI